MNILLQETRIKRIIDAAAEIEGKVKVVRKPTVTTNKAKTKEDDKTANSSMYLSHMLLPV